MTSPGTPFIKGGGRFHLKRQLGEGGFGVVYEALDTTRNAVVALKTLRRFEPSALYRFKQEFRTLADIDHPHVVSLYELFSEGDDWFFTMELVNGVPFIDHVRPRTSGGALDLDRLRAVISQVADALHAIHQIGILHRDIKPSNVLVTPDHRAVLLDFGLVTELATTDNLDDVHQFGSPVYMSPEDGAGLPISEASDWYSVGVMLYEALTGARPFGGAVHEILAEKQQREPPPPTSVRSGIPDDLDRLCCDLLRRDPTARPSGAEVLRRLADSAPSAGELGGSLASRPISTLLIGRDGHLAALRDAYETAARHAVTVCVQGRSGAGKTALVRRFLSELRKTAPEAVVFSGRCYQQESVPYKAVDAVIDQLARYLLGSTAVEAARLLPRDVVALTRLFPALREIDPVPSASGRLADTTDSQELRRRAFAALRELLGALADQSPLVVFIDDLQWGDLDSAMLLNELLRPPDPPALLLIVACRSEDRDTSPLLQTLLPLLQGHATGRDFRQIDVGELSPSEARRLARALLGTTPSAAAYADAIARQSDGSPFFVEELVRYALESEEVVRLDQVLQARVARLAPDARQLVELVAVMGQPLDVAVAVAAASSQSLERTVHQLRAQRLVRMHGASPLPALEMYHDRIREAIVASLDPATLRDHHARLATAWEATGRADSEVLAIHYHAAGHRERAAIYAEHAAALADEALAFDRAARLYRLAIELRAAETHVVRHLRVKLGDALANAGRGVEAAQTFEHVARDAPDSEALDLRRRAAYYYSASGHVDEGNEAFRQVLTQVGMRLPQTPLAKLGGLLAVRAALRARGPRFHLRDASTVDPQTLQRIDVAWSVGTGLGLIDLSTGWQFTSRSLLLALQAGEPFRIARALAWEAATSASMSLAGQRRASRLLDECASLTQMLDRPYPRGMLSLARGLAAYSGGRWMEARGLLADAANIFTNECTGTSWELSTLYGFQLRNLLMLGDFAELRLRARDALQRAEQTGDLYFVTFHGVFIEPHLRLFADEPDEARRSVEAALSRWSHRGYHIQHALAAEAIPAIDLYVGHAAAAVDSLREQWPLMKKHFLLTNLVYRRGVLELRGRAHIAAAAEGANRDRDLRAAERDERSLRGLGQPCLAPFIALLQGGAAYTRGDADRARALLALAADGFAERGLNGLLAATRRTLGILHGGTQGLEMLKKADEFLRAQHIISPSRFTAMLVPGFPDARVERAPAATL